MFPLVWLFLALLIGVWAQRGGRNLIGWALLAVVLSPLLAGLVLLVIGPTTRKAPIPVVWTKK